MPDHNPHRRDFLRDSSTALLLAGAASRATADSEEAKIRVAVVGTGGRGCDLIRALTTIDSCDLAAVCDDYAPHLERGLKFAQPTTRGFARYSLMLRETRPQAVVVATPLARHLEMAQEAIEHGCAVFCEKTMTRTLDEARALTALVKRKQFVFQVGLQRRANAIYRQAVAMVHSGMLGDISAIRCQWHRNHNWRRPVPVPRSHADWNALEKRLNWRLYRETSGGLMTELASHQIDVANWILGSPPRRVQGCGGIDSWRDGRTVFDNVHCIYEYTATRRPNPARAHPAPPEDNRYTVRVTYSSIQNNAYEGASELILGTKGTLFLTSKVGLFYREADPENPGWASEGRVQEDAALITAGKTLKLANDPWAHRGKPYEINSESDDTRDELVAFLQSVRNNAATICPATTGLENAATVLLANQAMDEGRAIDFPCDLEAAAPA